MATSDRGRAAGDQAASAISRRIVHCETRRGLAGAGAVIRLHTIPAQSEARGDEEGATLAGCWGGS